MGRKAKCERYTSVLRELFPVRSRDEGVTDKAGDQSYMEVDAGLGAWREPQEGAPQALRALALPLTSCVIWVADLHCASLFSPIVWV